MRQIVCIVLCALLALAALAQDPKPVPIGKGSYAEFPPAAAGDGAKRMTTTTPYKVINQGNRAIPTNQWWTDLVISQFAGKLFAYPFAVQPNKGGFVDLYYQTRWSGNNMGTDAPLQVGGVGFAPTGSPAKDWGDWSVCFRMPETDTKYMDVTVGRGMPCVWFEFAGVSPTITASGAGQYFDDTGAKIAMPVTGDHFGIEAGGRCWGVFAPAKTAFAVVGEALTVKFADPKKTFLVIGALPTREDLARFYPYAYGVPRDTQLSFSYDQAAGTATTHWKVISEPLQGKETKIIQGWIPHQWRTTTRDFAFNGMEYLTARGKMKCGVGDRFDIAYKFNGILPTLPAPEATKDANPYQPARMTQYLADYAKVTKYGDETYFGGKDLTKFGQYSLFAQQMKDPSQAAILENAKKSMTDWYTYTPGEKSHFFARYPNWRALVGFSESFWSYQFTDHHFHYGYSTYAAAMVGLQDPQWLRDYGPMAKQVAKEYGNWDRTDTDYPYLRNFDRWEGHGWAGGFSSPGGNNQESSSEDAQAWGGIFLLGAAMDDKDMMAAGAALYAMDTEAIKEYWFNQYGGNFPKDWPHPITVMVWGNGLVYATYFSGDKGWFYGIQWLPQSPILTYLGEDPAFAKKTFQAMVKAREADNEKDKNDFVAAGTALGQVIQGYRAWFEPEAVAADFDRAWAANNGPIRDADTPGLSYYYSQSLRMLGVPMVDYHTNLPMSRVFYNAKAKQWSYVAQNTKDTKQTVRVFRNDVEIGTFDAAPNSLTRATTLTMAKNMPPVLATEPRTDAATPVSRGTGALGVVFGQPVDPASLAGMKITGPGVTGLTASVGNDPRLVTLTIEGRLAFGAKYTVTVPKSVKTEDGKPALTKDYAWSFTSEPEPPLAITATTPRDRQGAVGLGIAQVTLTFSADVDAKTLADVKIAGKGVTGLTVAKGSTADRIVFDLQGKLEADGEYTITIPATAKSLGGKLLGKEKVITFSTPAAASIVYVDSFAGGYSKEAAITVDLVNTEGPHSGKCAIKITAERDATIYFFAGATDNGPGRKALDLTNYDTLEFYMKGDAEWVWLKIGHPVFDKAFYQTRQTGITGEYKRFTLPVPSPKGSIGTILGISVQGGKSVYIDDMRFVAGE